MATYITLLEALRSGIITSEDFVDYNPDKSRTMYPKHAYSPVTNTLLHNEFNLGWHPVLYKNFAVLLISDKKTESEWCVAGNISFENLKEYSNLYENKNLQSCGAVPTPELLSEIPEKLRKSNVWTFTHYQARGSGYRTRSSYNPAFTNNRRYFNRLGPMYRIHAMQPIVFIPSNTVVEIDNPNYNGKSKEQGYKLFSCQSSEANNVCKSFQEPMWISLTEALMTGNISQSDFVEYVPDKAEVSFSLKETHAEKVQKAETEYDLGGWHPIVIRNKNEYKLYIVPTHCSKFKLNIPVLIKQGDDAYCTEVEGESQYNNGINLLTKYSKIYSNSELNAHGIPFTEELFDALDNSLILEGDTYWLANTFTHKFHWAAGYPLSAYGYSHRYALRLGLMWIARGVYEYKHRESPVSEMSIRVAASFPNDVMVEINNPERDGSSQEKAFKLRKKQLSKKDD